MDSPNVYRVRFIQNQRYAINISAPSAELAEFFAEEIRKRAGAAPFEAIGEPFSADWQSEEICAANTPDLIAAVANALDQLRRGGPRWTIEECLANALGRARAHGSVS
jgi:hypothetical protein